MTKILVVDDEPPIVEVLRYNLQRASYEVVVACDGEEALSLARFEQPDLILLDLMLPKLDGAEVFRILRRERDVPVIMLTALDGEVDRIVGLELGADDYVVKPFSVRELLARVRNVLRRVTPLPEEGPQPLRAGELVVDPARYEAYVGPAPLELTTLEFQLLHALAARAGRVLSRELLLEEVWGYTYTGDLRVVDAAIKRLRGKLREAAADREFIETVRGVGYKLVPEG